MSVSASWLNPVQGEHRRNRFNARARQHTDVKLALVPASAAPQTKSRSTPVVAPADYARTHAAVGEQRHTLEVCILLVAAIVLHATVAWWLSQPVVAKPLTPPLVPIEVVITKPPVIPPVVAPQPPKPRPVQKLQTPRPTPRVVETPQPDAITVPPPPHQVEAAPAPVVETISEARADADYLQNPAPAYPSLAQRQGWEGVVWLHVLVRPDGSPGQVDLEKSSGRKTLDDAALAAVKKWRFVPAKRGDVAVDGWVSVPIEFKLGK